VTLSDFTDADGRLILYPRVRFSPSAALQHRTDLSPWNTGLAYANRLLDEAFGQARRRGVYHVPLLIERDSWREMIARWPEAFAHTRRSRFRARYNVPAAHMYPYYLLATGRARMESLPRSYRRVAYCPLENLRRITRLRFALIARQRPKIVCYNDNFGVAPDPRVVRMTQAFLERLYPVPSRFEGDPAVVQGVARAVA
jgi:hypothetical protein